MFPSWAKCTFKFDIRVGRPELSKNVYQCILDILTELVQEAQHLPSEAVALIVKQFSKKRRVSYSFLCSCLP